MVSLAVRIFLLLRRFQHKISLNRPAADYCTIWSMRFLRHLLWEKTELYNEDSILVCELELSLSSNQNRYRIKMLWEANKNIVSEIPIS